jgi:hypothetical protein
MNERKFAFIMCSNNEQYAREAQHYIERLTVPKGYTSELLIVNEAPSMTAGYNEAMQGSDAKYKIYLHQDVMLVEQDFLNRLLSIFADEKVGMVGMVGSPRLPENGVMWYGDRIGSIYSCSGYGMLKCDFEGEVEAPYQRVEAVDGLLMATQYDVPWREDLFTGWDFYDISQCEEFRKRGYDIVVPRMTKPWCIHDDGAVNLTRYFETRKIFLKEYRGMECE